MEEKSVTRELLFRNIIKLGLTKREQEVISLRYGLDDNQPLSKDEVAIEKNISREEVLRIEKKAMLLLRNGENIHKLRQMMENNSQSEEIKSRRSKRNLYKYFGEYTEEQVDKALSDLNDEEMNLLTQRYGKDLKNPELNEMRNKDLKVLNTIVFKKIEDSLVAFDTTESDDKEQEESKKPKVKKKEIK